MINNSSKAVNFKNEEENGKQFKIFLLLEGQIFIILLRLFFSKLKRSIFLCKTRKAPFFFSFFFKQGAQSFEFICIIA